MADKQSWIINTTWTADVVEGGNVKEGLEIDCYKQKQFLSSILKNFIVKIFYKAGLKKLRCSLTAA